MYAVVLRGALLHVVGQIDICYLLGIIDSTSAARTRRLARTTNNRILAQ